MPLTPSYYRAQPIHAGNPVTFNIFNSPQPPTDNNNHFQSFHHIDNNDRAQLELQAFNIKYCHEVEYCHPPITIDQLDINAVVHLKAPQSAVARTVIQARSIIGFKEGTIPAGFT